MKQYNLIADVGGTNIRLALLIDDTQVALTCFKCADFDSLEAVVKHYISLHCDGVVINACFGIAGPVVGDVYTMTNLGWRFSVESLQQALGLEQVYCINDYTAISMSVPKLSPDDLYTVHSGEIDETEARVICGPGTGLGLALLVKVNDYYQCLSGEGGHSEFAPNNLMQLKVLEVLMSQFSHVSVERLLSGQGIVNIYQALAKIKQQDAPVRDASEISQGYIDKADELCIETMELFCDVLAQFLGSTVLCCSGFGGVYIAGGIMPRIIDYIDIKRFISAYSAKGRMGDYVMRAPIYLITHPQPGLIGASVYLNQQINKGKI